MNIAFVVLQTSEKVNPITFSRKFDVKEVEGKYGLRIK